MLLKEFLFAQNLPSELSLHSVMVPVKFFCNSINISNTYFANVLFSDGFEI